MADGEEEIDEAKLLEQITWLRGSIKRRDKLMLLLGFITILLTTIIATGFTVLYKKVNKAVTAVDTTISKDVAKFKSGMVDVDKLTLEYGNKVKRLDLMLNNLELNEETSTLSHMRTLIIEQEDHIQQFLIRMKTGSYYLARMLPGSRAWFEDHEDSINKAIHSSTQRKRQIKALIPMKLRNIKTPAKSANKEPDKVSNTKAKATKKEHNNSKKTN